MAITPGEVTSNVVFADYAGTQACAKCHAGHVKTWLASPMHNMTREPSLADVAQENELEIAGYSLMPGDW